MQLRAPWALGQLELRVHRTTIVTPGDAISHLEAYISQIFGSALGG
ncbi:hypothetical protein [Marivita sp.]|jgi:hypothetical protein